MKGYTDKFLENWDRFCTNLRANMRDRSKGQPVTLSSANAVLKDVVSNWLSPYDANGRWLNELIEHHPQQGEQIKQIITKQLWFKNENKDTNSSKNTKYGVSVMSGVIGAGIATSFGASMLIKMVAMIVPAAAVYRTLDYIDVSKKGTLANSGIYYTEQLNEYREMIIEVLSELQE